MRKRTPKTAHSQNRAQKRTANKKTFDTQKKNPGTQNNSPKRTVTGKIRISKSGNGFIDLDKGGSVLVPRKELSTAISGDIVKVALFPPRKDKPGDAGEVIDIIKRGTTHIAGIIDCEGKNFFLKPIKFKFPFLIHIEPGQLNGATCGSAALAKINSWQSDIPGNITGEITKVYGARGDHETDMALILGDSLAEPEFTNDLLKEVRELKEVNTEDAIASGRRDFRNVTTVTIDPERAQDFDDALSIVDNKDGTYEIGIHIADVSHYVIRDSAIDIEAYRRGTSIYLVDRCIPMLPERLSNDLCSLREGVARLSMSVVVHISKDGAILDTWAGPGIIKSDKRFMYHEVDQILHDKKGLFHDELRTLMDISEILEKDRVARGSLVFNRAEYRFVLDESGKPTDIIKETGGVSHGLIESFMLLANQITADIVENWNSGQGKTRGMYRVHGKPNESALQELITFAKQCGIRTPSDATKPIQIIKHLIKKSMGMSVAPIMTDMIIRAQAKAHYSEINSGHFGLAMKSYGHFTSPIRRYPDLIMHRMIKTMLKTGDHPYEKKELHDAAEHASDREEKASEAERASIRYKQIEFLEQNVGDERNGILVGMTETIMKIIDDRTGAMVHAEITKIKLTLGDTVLYTLTAADRLQDVLTGTIKEKIEQTV